jgi:hypothetical protein
MPELGPRLTETIRIKAGQFGIPAPLIEAMALVESAGRLFAIRHEPDYRWLWNCATSQPFRRLSDEEAASARPPADFVVPKGWPSNAATEWMGQKTSWGPLQVMGAVAREHGYAGALPELCSELGVYNGCLHMDRLRARWFGGYGWAGVVAAYNAGSVRVGVAGEFQNQAYVDKVRKALGCPFSQL